MRGYTAHALHHIQYQTFGTEKCPGFSLNNKGNLAFFYLFTVFNEPFELYLLIGDLIDFFRRFNSGKDAVLGGMLMTAVGYIIWGFIAPRFTTAAPVAVERTGKV